MALNVLDMQFDGPWLSENSVPERAGVYLVTKQRPEGKYPIVDVGQSENMRDRLINHDRKACWMTQTNTPRFWVYYEQTEQNRLIIEARIRAAWPKIPCGQR